MENEKKTDSREWELDAETEYRFELDPGTSLAIKVRQRRLSVLLQGLNFLQLVQGQAEVFGTELAKAKQYLFGSECKASVFTWQGCVLEISFIQFQNSLMFDAYLIFGCTSQAIPLLNMSQKKRRWPHMQIYISRSSKCASVLYMQFTVHQTPTMILMRMRSRHGCLCWDLRTLAKQPCVRFLRIMLFVLARIGPLCW